MVFLLAQVDAVFLLHRVTLTFFSNTQKAVANKFQKTQNKKARLIKACFLVKIIV